MARLAIERKWKCIAGLAGAAGLAVLACVPSYAAETVAFSGRSAWFDKHHFVISNGPSQVANIKIKNNTAFPAVWGVQLIVSNTEGTYFATYCLGAFYPGVAVTSADGRSVCACNQAIDSMPIATTPVLQPGESLILTQLVELQEPSLSCTSNNAGQIPPGHYVGKLNMKALVFSNPNYPNSFSLQYDSDEARFTAVP